MWTREGFTGGPGRPARAARPAASSAIVRFSLGQVGDVEVTPGTTLAECRDVLDALLGPSAGAELSVSGHVLVPEQVAGLPPWLPGSHVDVGPTGPGRWGGTVDLATLASAPWHAAVVAGPDAGAVAAPGPDGRLSLGRGPGLSRDDGARLALSDPAVSRRHAVLLTGRRGVTVRDVGSANRTWRRRVRRGTRAERALPPWRAAGPAPWRPVRRRARLRAGDRLRLGGTELELRDEVTPSPSGASPGSGAGARASGADGGAGRTGVGEPSAPKTSDGEPGARAGRVAAAVAPLLVAGAMAAVLHNPVFLLMAAVGPLVAVVPAVSARLARRRSAGGPLPDLGPDAAALTVLLARGCTDLPTWWTLARDGLAVLADDDARGAVGRVLVGGALLDPTVALTLLTVPDASAGWSWARWVAPRLGGEPGARVAAAGAAALDVRTGRHLVVADGPGAWRTDLERWWLARGPAGTERPDRAVVVLLGPGAARPAWCRWLLTVTDGRAHLSGHLTATRVTRDLPAPGASLAWAEAFARQLAARDAAHPGRPVTDAAGLSTPGAELPACVGPGDVGLPCDVDAVVGVWGAGAAGRRVLPGLRVPLGLAAGPQGVRTAWLDLLTDGPHALVAGTTGAGKSELLQALVLGLALRHPPAELGLVLLDFKGGAGLRACADLPHVVGRVSDLDPEQAVRALEGLTAELRRREALLAAAGVSDLESLRCRTAEAGAEAAPARLVVVVDEFRALAEDLPDFVPALVRLAAQGRSLGMHLVLATQRPAGAVTAQMRANLALRVCLRVTDAAESRDVVDVPDAADLPARSPGRAVVRRADGAPETVQTTWVALPARRRPPVRRALEWTSFGTPEQGGEADGTSGATWLAGVVTAAAERLGVPPATPLWTPPLPALVGHRELADATRPGAARAGDSPRGDRTGGPTGSADLVLGLTDPPGAARRELLTWDGVGLLLVAGAAGSGRTTAAARAGIAALASGRHVHAVGPVAALLPGAHPGLGTTVDDRDPRRLARLLTLLATGSTGSARGDCPGAILLVDDVPAAAAALERLPRGVGSDLVERLARDAARCGIGLLVTGHPRDVARLAPLATARLVLPVADAGDDGLLGVPRELSGRTLPGRAVLVAGGTARRCHVAMPDAAGAGAGAHGSPVGAPAPLRLRPIPERVPRTPGVRPTTSAAGWEVTVGAGGDDAGPVAVDARRGVLVVGPGGSGRSTALATLALGLAAAGRRVSVLARDGALTALAGTPGLRCVPTAEAAALGAPAARATGRDVDVLVVDDLDLVARSCGELDDRLAAWVHAVERGDPAPAVLASCRTDRAAAAYRGAVAALRGSAPALVLSPGEPGSAEAAGADVAAGCDPTLPRHPGRGVLVVQGRAAPVQVAGPA